VVIYIPWRKSYATVREFYKAVEALATDLRANGKESEAVRLDELLNGVWTTGSELIGELMVVLACMKGDFPEDIRKRINDCRYFAEHHRRILGLG
jgi:hypothetical protein